jgi:HEPN domain-containing protein
MRDPEKVVVVVAEWVEKAENDFKAAAQILKLGKQCPTDTVCFHVQRCAEKYLKAVLVSRTIRFSKTHDLQELVALLPTDARVEMDLAEQRRLTGYAVALRYPDYPPIPLVEARKAMTLARRVRRELRRLLPKSALRRTKKS